MIPDRPPRKESLRRRARRLPLLACVGATGLAIAAVVGAMMFRLAIRPRGFAVTATVAETIAFTGVAGLLALAVVAGAHRLAAPGTARERLRRAAAVAILAVFFAPWFHFLRAWVARGVRIVVTAISDVTGGWVQDFNYDGSLGSLYFPLSHFIRFSLPILVAGVCTAALLGWWTMSRRVLVRSIAAAAGAAACSWIGMEIGCTVVSEPYLYGDDAMHYPGAAVGMVLWFTIVSGVLASWSVGTWAEIGAAGRCWRCGYDLAGLKHGDDPPCPECGARASVPGDS